MASSIVFRGGEPCAGELAEAMIVGRSRLVFYLIVHEKGGTGPGEGRREERRMLFLAHFPCP
jgi:hypothetical protein